MPVIDSAHRTSAAKPLPGKPPRAMLVRLHYYQTKELILRASRERGQLSYKGKRIHIFPDYSATLARRRAEFKDVKAQLYQAGVKFGLIHPAKLRITFQGSAHTFDTPDAGLQFFRTTIQPTTKWLEEEVAYLRILLNIFGFGLIALFLKCRTLKGHCHFVCANYSLQTFILIERNCLCYFMALVEMAIYSTLLFPNGWFK